MDCVQHTLSFLFEEEKIPLFLSCRAVYGAYRQQVEEIRICFFVLREYNWDRGLDLVLRREIEWDLASDHSSHTD